jgi:hypothetical protein
VEVEVMGCIYCQSCDRLIDLDYDVDHEDHCAEDQAAMWERSGVPKPEGQRATMGVMDDTEKPEEEK